MADRPLRIAWLAQDFPPSLGGTQRYNVEYARRLRERGHDLRVLTWGPDAEADAALPFPVVRAPRRRGRRGLDPHGVRETLHRWESELAVASGGSRALARVVSAASREAPVALAVHDLRDKGATRSRPGRWRLRRSYAFHRVSRFLANSRDTRARLLRLGVAEARIDVVYPGVDTRHFAPDAAAGARLRAELGLGERPLLLSVSRLSRNKGHAQVLEVLPRLRAALPGLVYAVVGDGGERERLERRAAELGVADAVHFAGAVPDVRPWYCACDVFVMPSARAQGDSKAAEGFGIAYAEAAACGKPAVASDSGGGPEVVCDGETGRIVPAGDAEALAGALLLLLREPERARALGEKARGWIGRYDWSEGVARLERALRALAPA